MPFCGIAQVSTPKYSNEFLQIGTGARALALGGAMTSAIQPEESGYWNPAVLSESGNNKHFSLMHSEYFGGVAAYDYFSVVLPVDSISSFSFSLIRMGVDDIPDTRLLYDAGGVIDYDKITFFSAVDLALLFSYGRKIALGNGISVGGNVKIIRRKAGDFARAWGFGIDLAARTTVKGWVMGAMFRDVSSTFNAWSHSTELIEDVYASSGNTLPQNSMELTLPSLSLGVSREIYSAQSLVLSVMHDFRLTFDGKRNTLLATEYFSVDPVTGMELGISEMLFFRLGVSKWQKALLEESYMAELSGGVGFQYKNIKFHYSLNRNNGFESAHYSHGFSLNFELLKK